MTSPSATPMPSPAKTVHRKMSGQKLLPQRQKNGAEDAAGQRVQRKGAAQNGPAPDQHGQVEHQQKAGDGQACQPPESQRDAGGTAGHEPGRLQK